MQFFLRVIATIVTILVIVPVPRALAALSPTYFWLAQSIDTATGEGIAKLNLGRFSGNHGDLRFVIVNTVAKELSFKFDYKFSAIYSGVLDFKQTPVVVVAAQNDVCVAVEIQLIVISPGGFLDETQSKFHVLTNHPDCPHPKTELANAAAGLFRLPITPSGFFQASWFEWQSSLRKCLSDNCQNPNKAAVSFFKQISFFPMTPRRGLTPPLGLSVTFAEGGNIQWGRGDALYLATDSSLIFSILFIDVENQRVTAHMTNISLPLEKGTISADGMQLNLESGSKFEASNFDIDGTDESVSFRGTKISGSVGAGSKITISHGATVAPSTVTFASATLTLGGVDLFIKKDYVKFSATSGRFDSSVSDAELHLGPSVLLYLGAATFNVTFRCPIGSPGDCRPFVGETNKPLLSMGAIDPLSIASKRGSYTSTSVGTIQLDRGDVTTGTLEFDSRKSKGPIWGNIKTFAVAVSSQMLRLDSGLSLRALNGTLNGEDLTISSADSLPVGDLRLAIDISEFDTEGFGRVVTLRGSSTMTALLRREEGSDIHILNGIIDATISASSYGGSAQGKMRIVDLDLYRGNGGARFTLSIPQFSYGRLLPGSSQTDGSLAEVTVTVFPETISATLTTPINLDGKQVFIRSGKWSIEPVTFPVEARVSLLHSQPDQDENDKDALVKGEVEGAGITVCTSRVILPFHDYLAHFNGSLVVQSGTLGFHSTPFKIDPYPKPTIDGKSCKRAATLLCGLGGAALGPIGAIGAAYFCNDEFGKGEDALQSHINDLVQDGIQSTRFDVGP